jgi:hypothetical protein
MNLERVRTGRRRDLVSFKSISSKEIKTKDQIFIT